MGLLRKTLFFAFIFPALALGIDIPPHSGLVVDSTGTLSSQQKNKLEASLRRFQEVRGPQIQLLLISSLEGEPIESYSIRVVDAWKLGDKKRDDGVLLLVAKDDREVRIEVGQGLEGMLPDVVAGRIIRNDIVPYFREGNYFSGIVSGLGAIARGLGGNLEGFSSSRTKVHGRPLSEGAMYLLLMFIIIVMSFFRRSRSGRAWSSRSGWLPVIYGGMGGFGGGGGFSGGGGGGFSGGGASGRW